MMKKTVFLVSAATWVVTGLAAAQPVCLLFIHPGAPNLISLRSAGTMPA